MHTHDDLGRHHPAEGLLTHGGGLVPPVYVRFGRAAATATTAPAATVPGATTQRPTRSAGRPQPQELR